jgi:two-component system, response regulator / RNA-binding antiterminator
MSTKTEPAPLRVLIANERHEDLPIITEVVVSIGHTVVAAGVDLEEIGEATRRELPDVALIGLGDDSAHALGLIDRVVHEAACPVIALLHAANPNFVNEAAKRGIFAYLTDGDAQTLQSALDIVLRRFAEYQNLEGAFARRATIERAKGILMAVHAIDEQEAFDLLRRQSQESGRKLIDLAEAITNSHRLLAPRSEQQTGG